MDDPAMAFCTFLRLYCDRLDKSCTSLKESIDRKAIPLDFSTSFLHRLERSTSSLSNDLESLGSMVIDTVSFEELLGHCSEIYKSNFKCIAEVEEKIKEFGVDLGSSEIDEDGFGEDLVAESPISGRYVDADPLSSVERENRPIRDHPLLDDSLCFQELGFSDIFLSTLASEGGQTGNADDSSSMSTICEKDNHVADGSSSKNLLLNASALLQNTDDLISGSTGIRIKITRNDYDQLPSYLRILASWEELHDAVSKMNTLLCGQGIYSFDQNMVESLGSGLKARPCLLLLLRMKSLVIENCVDGVTVYRVADT